MSYAVTRLVVDTERRDVFDVLRDGWLYSYWLRGARRIRSVDENWPDVGSKLWHALGGFGLTMIRDSTTVRAVDDDSMIELGARARPLGAFCVRIRLAAIEGGTLVTMEERPVEGEVERRHNPLVSLLLHHRNRSSLRRLRRLARGRARERKATCRDSRSRSADPG